jgi:CubicO group peptidase (beta-lactamase class C family)
MLHPFNTYPATARENGWHSPPPNSHARNRTMRNYLFTALSLLALCGTTYAAEPNATTAVQAQVPDEWQSLHDRWQRAVDELKIPGVAIVVVKGDQVVLLDALGVCDADGQQRVAPDSPFYLASVTKSFTALGVCILVEEGKVKLDEPVQTYLPRFTLHDPQQAAEITVRDLLSHRKGLDSSPISLAEAYFGNITDDRYYSWLASVRPRNRYSYSNLHYTLLGRIIEAVTGQSWKDFLAERVFAPLKMHGATCYASKLYASPAVAWPTIEHAGRWQRAPLVKNDSVMHAAGGMGCSAADMAQWMKFHLTGMTPDGKQLVSQQMLKEIHTRQATSEKPRERPDGFIEDGYSLGWQTGKLGDHDLLCHGGGYVGTSTLVTIVPDANVGVAVLMNESSPTGGFTTVVTRDVLEKLLGLSTLDVLPKLREGVAKSRERMAKSVDLAWDGAASGLTQPIDRYAATYQNEKWGEVVVRHVDEKLTLQIGTLTPRWHALEKNRFRLEISPGDVVQGRFKVDEAGNVTTVSFFTPIGNAEFLRAK